MGAVYGAMLKAWGVWVRRAGEGGGQQPSVVCVCGGGGVVKQVWLGQNEM